VKEDNWIHNYYHAATRQVINFCLQHGCGTIHLEALTRLRTEELQEDKSEYDRLIWVPSKFNELLAYKAEELGIQLVKVNPRNTSRRCHRCGYISRDNRKTQSKFVCEQCGDARKPVNADYNAAKNIAMATEEVIKDGYKIEEIA
jgi:IS605 OrfB family transposase